MRKQPRIILSAGRSCFVKCNGCYNHFGDSSLLSTTENILKFLKEARKKGIEKLTIGGGDPLSRPDILDLVREINGLGFEINLDTVGSSLTNTVNTIFFGRKQVEQVNAAELVPLIDEIGIPLDGPNSEVIRTFRTGRQNIFEEQIEIIEFLSVHDAPICLNTVVHAQNHTRIPEMVPIIFELNKVKNWQLFQFMPIGPLGYKNRDKYMLDDHLFDQAKAVIQKEIEKFGLKNRVEFKGRGERKGNYLLVDANGSAWIPRTSLDESWDNDQDGGERVILGNINNEKDYEKIFNFILSGVKSLDSRAQKNSSADNFPTHGLQ